MANRFWVGGSGNWNTTDTTHWSTTNGGAGGASVPTIADSVIIGELSGNGTTTLTSNVTAQDILFYRNDYWGGTFDAATYNVTLANGVVCIGDTACTIKLGSGTWDMSSGWNLSATALTLDAGTSTVKVTYTLANPLSMYLGGHTFNNLWISRGASALTTILYGGGTFNDIKDDGTVAHTLKFESGYTFNVNTFTVSGTSGKLVTLDGTTTATYALVKNGGGTIQRDYLNIQHAVATPANTWYAGLHSVNNQGTATSGSGWIFGLPTSDSRSASVSGSTTDEDERDASIRGSVDSADNRSASLAGLAIGVGERDASVRGMATDEDERDASIRGSLKSVDSRPASIGGSESGIDDRPASLKGEFGWGSAVISETPNIITIEGIDRSICFLNATMSIENISSDSPSILKAEFFDKDNLGSPELDDEIIITKDGVKLFAGKLLEISYLRLGATENILTLTCTDYIRELNRNLVKENYKNMTDKEIIQDIVLRYCIGSGITASEYVEENITVKNIVFNYLTPGDCIKKLCSLSNYNWYIDYDKKIHYFPLTQNVSPFSINVHSVWVKDLQISKDNSNVRNRVYVRGGTYLSAVTTISQVADGEQTIFILPEKPHELTVTEGATIKTVGAKNLDSFTDYDYLVSFQEKYAETDVAPAQGTVMTFTFTYDIPVLVAAEDRDSIEEIGQYEFAIFDSNIKDLDDARARAMGELTDYAHSIIDGSFSTYQSGFYSGQYVNINLASMGINDDYLIQKVTAQSLGKGLFIYKVSVVNTKKIGIIGFLKRMLETEKNIVNADIDEVVDELYMPTSQDIIITDTLISSDFTAPPFKWSTATWGFAQWTH